MTIEFIDTQEVSVHDEFQEWRTGHQDGVFLTLNTQTRANLHGARCQHLGSGPPYFTLSDGFGSLTSKRKVCGTEDELFLWALKNGVAVERCGHCVRDQLVGGEPEKGAPTSADPGTSKGIAADRDDVNSTQEFAEGAIENVLATRYERNREARRVCLAHYGTTCRACDLEMGRMYGPLGEGYIHVHHKVPLSTIGEEYRLDPIKDLVPVCPNCHAILHRTATLLEVEALAEIIHERGRAAEQAEAAGAATRC